jgi:hypothetical protein
MGQQLWGCYAVNDHMQSRPFVADVLLFERLVIPVPPEDDPEALKPWKAWQPDRQRELLDILGDIAYRVPWSSQLRRVFAAQWAAGIARVIDGEAEERRQDLAGGVSPQAQAATIMTLSREVSSKIFDQPDVRALAVYTDPMRFDREWYFSHARPFVTARKPAGSGRRKVVTFGREWYLSRGWPFVTAREPADAGEPDFDVEKAVPAGEYELARLLVSRLAVPERPDRSDQDMLKEAVELAAEPKMAEWRASYYEWISTMASRDLPETRKIREMAELVDAYNSAVTKKRRATAAKLTGVVVGTGAGVGAAIFGGPLLGVAAALPVATMTEVAAKRVFGDGPPERIAAGALLAEAAKELSKS